MPTSNNNVKLGVCTVLFDGVDLGLTQGGVEVNLDTSTHEVKVDQYGETPINQLITGRVVKAKVPLAETTLDNLVATMPGSTMVGNGTKATGTVTFATAAPANGDSVTINGQAFTFKTAPVGVYEVAPGATFSTAAAAFAAAVNAAGGVVKATVAAGVVTLTATDDGVDGNTITLAKSAATPANLTVSGATLTGGVDATKKKVVIKTGVSLSLFDFAKTLVLRPVGSNGTDDFVMHKAATAGQLTYAYMIDKERVFNVEFMGYPMNDGTLVTVGDITA